MFDEKLYKAKWYKDNKIRLNKRAKKRYLDNITKIKEKYSIYRVANNDIILERGRKRGKKCIESWKGYIPKVTRCEICSSKIIFNSGTKGGSINFDHKNEGKEVIKGNPSSFLRSRIKDERTTAIWESCHFGMLCWECNKRLPTKNRKIFLQKSVEYTFGKNYKIVKEDESGREESKSL